MRPARGDAGVLDQKTVRHVGLLHLLHLLHVHFLMKNDLKIRQEFKDSNTEASGDPRGANVNT